jgi:acyl-CoA thioesterase
MAGRDRTAGLLGYEVVAVGAGRAVVTMVVGDAMVNGLDVCHGGIIFTLADSAMAHASNSHGPVAFAVAASIDFVNPGRLGARLTATATEQFRRGRTGLYDVVVTDDDGAVVARFHGRTQASSQG